MEQVRQLETVSIVDHSERPSDVCCLKVTVLNCSTYHKFKKKGHHAKLDQRLYICPKKHLLLQVSGWHQMICKFRMLSREADAHMNHQARSLIDCN